MAKVYQPSPRAVAARINGRKGGLARAARLSRARRIAIAAKAGSKTMELYGTTFYGFINPKRRRHGKKGQTKN